MNQDVVKYINDLILSSEIQYHVLEDNSIHLWWFNDNYLMDYHESINRLDLSFRIWSVLKSKYKLNNLAVNKLMNNWMKQHHNIDGFNTGRPNTL